LLLSNLNPQKYIKMTIKPSLWAALAMGTLVTSSSFGLTAQNFGMFHAEEEPNYRYYPNRSGTSRWQNDPGYDNMVQLSGVTEPTFVFKLRYNQAGEHWWDNFATIDTGTTDRGRAEVKGLGTNQVNGQTYEYVSSWKVKAGFQNSNRFTHIFQLFGVQGGGSHGYLVQSELKGQGSNNGKIILHQGGSNSSGSTVDCASFTFTPDVYQTHRIEVKIASGTSGYAGLRINGGSLVKKNGNTQISGADGYRPKWGVYRGFDDGWSWMGNTEVFQKSIQSNKL
jgi:hypothetical protein